MMAKQHHRIKPPSGRPDDRIVIVMAAVLVALFLIAVASGVLAVVTDEYTPRTVLSLICALAVVTAILCARHIKRWSLGL